MLQDKKIDVGDYVTENGEHHWVIYADGEMFYESPRLERVLRALRLLDCGTVNHYAALFSIADEIVGDIGGLDTITMFAALVKMEDLPCLRR